MQYPVKLELFKDDVFFEELIANNADDLYCRIEMDTGIGWLETEPLHQMLVASGREQVTDTFRVCHSYEKWGDLQQEVVEVKVIMHRIKPCSASEEKRTEYCANSVTDRVEERVDLRSEWYAEFDVYAASINRPPRIYWLGMILSAIWLVGYLIIYPSIPMVTAHGYWQGIGVPGGCQPWTAICEMEKAQSELNEVREKYHSVNLEIQAPDNSTSRRESI